MDDEFGVQFHESYQYVYENFHSSLEGYFGVFEEVLFQISVFVEGHVEVDGVFLLVMEVAQVFGDMW